MNTLRFASWSLVVSSCLVFACGGSTTDDSLPGTGGTGGSAGSSAGAAGSGAGSGGSPAGSAGAPAGAAGAPAGAAGAAGAAGNPAYFACTAPGDCLLTSASCCGQCGAATPADKAGVNHKELGAYKGSVCAGAGCPACFQETSIDLVAVCRASACSAVEVSKDPLSTCAVDDDCRLYPANQCCDCQPTTSDKYIALAKTGINEYQANVCGPGVGGCTADCIGAPPPSDIAAVCDKQTKHCAVVKALPAASCPTAIPKDGAPCTPPPTDFCEYGNGVNLSCRVHAQCQGGKWQVGLTGCPPTPGPGQAGCPVDLKANASDCATEGLVCDMGGGSSCLCSSCTGPCSTQATWHCAEAPSGGCPKTAPNVGQACGKAGQSCSYGVTCTSTGATRVCKDGVWTDETVACPL